MDSQRGVIFENWELETLSENGETSAENESSVILYANIGGQGLLFTGDAGIQALSRSVDFAKLNQINLEDLRFSQMPHHGSRRNISPSLLDKILGPRVPHGYHKNKTAFVSASKTSDIHPRKSVVNAYIRRGVSVHATQGNARRHSHNMPNRDGWVSSQPLLFNSQVER